MDEQKEKQNAKKKRSALPIYAIGIVWLLYAGKLNTFRGNVINLRPVHLFYAKKRQNKCSW